MTTSLILALSFASDITSACATLKPVTDLENIYCEIKKQGKGTYLPPFSEFRNNENITQYMLVKRDAGRLGLDVQRPPQKANSAKPKIVNTLSRPSSSIHESSPALEPSGLSMCTLGLDIIQCAGKQYRLLDNTNISRLPSYVLGPGNTLELLTNNSANRMLPLSELSEAYFTYIDKMVLIGLAASTLSFTKFVALYEEQEKQNERFSLRFKKMYELLKSERRKQGIKARYDSSRPHSMENCMSVKPHYIVCDNVTTNWVYQLNSQ